MRHASERFVPFNSFISNCCHYSSGTPLYTTLIDQKLCDTDKEKALKNYNKIIRIVAKEILVEK